MQGIHDTQFPLCNDRVLGYTVGSKVEWNDLSVCPVAIDIVTTSSAKDTLVLVCHIRSL